MEYLVIAFKSRAHTIKFYNLLSSSGIVSQIVNTPKQAGVGCGLSVKVKKDNLALVKRALFSANLSSFAGVFAVRELGGSILIKPVF